MAQEILACYEQPGIDRAWVNNGGDIALHRAPGQSVTVGVYADIAALNAAQLRNGLALDGKIRIDSAMPVRGVATSGWRGRSQSLGIADCVTVLARTAALADAAATIVANAVNVADVRIVRRPAWQVRDDSDLGAIPHSGCPRLTPKPGEPGLAPRAAKSARIAVRRPAVVCTAGMPGAVGGDLGASGAGGCGVAPECGGGIGSWLSICLTNCTGLQNDPDTTRFHPS